MSNLTKSEILMLKRFELFVLYQFEDMKIFFLLSFAPHFFPRFFCKVCRLQEFCRDTLLRSFVRKDKYFLRTITHLFIHVSFIYKNRSIWKFEILFKWVNRPLFHWSTCWNTVVGIESAENPWHYIGKNDLFEPNYWQGD